MFRQRECCFKIGTIVFIFLNHPVYRAGRRYHVQTKGVLLQDRDNCVHIFESPCISSRKEIPCSDKGSVASRSGQLCSYFLITLYIEQEGDTMFRQRECCFKIGTIVFIFLNHPVYRAGRRYHVQTKGVLLQDRDNCVGICIDNSEILMTCQGKFVVADCVGSLVVTL